MTKESDCLELSEDYLPPKIKEGERYIVYVPYQLVLKLVGTETRLVEKNGDARGISGKELARIVIEEATHFPKDGSIHTRVTYVVKKEVKDQENAIKFSRKIMD